MTQNPPTEVWEHEVIAARVKGDYDYAASLCKQSIEIHPQNRRIYWHLGVIEILREREEEAQLTWMMVLMEAPHEEEETWLRELLDILESAANEQYCADAVLLARTLRQHIRELAPARVDNALKLVQIAIKTNESCSEEVFNQGLAELLKHPSEDVPVDLLLEVIEQIPDKNLGDQPILDLVEASITYGEANPDQWIDVFLKKITRLLRLFRRPDLHCLYGELALRLNNNHMALLGALPGAYYESYNNISKGIALAERYNALATHPIDKIHACHNLIDGYMKKGTLWDKALEVFQKLIQQLNDWVEYGSQDQYIRENEAPLCNALFTLPYFSDCPRENRILQNNVGQAYQQQLWKSIEQHNNYQPCSKTIGNKAEYRRKESKIRIGYLARSMRRHSVGWLCRWLFHHHNREQFEVFAYFDNHPILDGFSQQWFVNNSHRSYILEGDILGIAQSIQSHNVDILIDLDSLTSFSNYGVMALKPAPVQVSWLGLDAPGLPTIDYFLADPYVLPENAQEYYSEKLWRLPQTYLAVDGFEVWMPTLRRDTLNIPESAVIYFTTQSALKLNPKIVQLQCQILRNVPNGYLLIKGTGDQEGRRQLFHSIAEQVGLERDRLRFLERDRFEEVHRANLGIADIVLDTFPYNGATTTMETLWMGIPLVTKVGKQFAARNSYTMMVNAGVEEGIAWSDDEYVEWGIRLGKDSELRDRIRWKLRQSRRTAPLWNAEQFTRQVEHAYEHMWEMYCEGSGK